MANEVHELKFEIQKMIVNHQKRARVEKSENLERNEKSDKNEKQGKIKKQSQSVGVPAPSSSDEI